MRRPPTTIDNRLLHILTASLTRARPLRLLHASYASSHPFSTPRARPPLRPCISCRACSSCTAMTAKDRGLPPNRLDSHAPAEPLIPATPLPFPTLCARIHDRVATFLDEKDVSDRVKGVQEQTRISLDVIYKALDQYSLSELSCAYNGGKDCLVLLVLYLSALHKKGLTKNLGNDQHESIQCVYIQAEHPFAEVEEFVVSSVKIYSLSLDEYAKPMKAAFTDYLNDRPTVKAIFVGTRRTDPHGEHLTHFDPTDHGWPSFMRIHPVIDWHYADIWTFIRYLNIPYCPLYDRGYTSLGGTTDTHPNPALRKVSAPQTPMSETLNGIPNGKNTPKFRPAYELIDDFEERLGRDK